VFVMATALNSTGSTDHWLDDQMDFNFADPPFEVEYDFSHHDYENYGDALHLLAGWHNVTWVLYKIENPDVKAGLKPANDPADFRAVDIWGHGDGSQWNIGGTLQSQNAGWTRKPGYYNGSPGFGTSFGTDEETSQWIKFDEDYWKALGAGWAAYWDLISDGIGSHYFTDITEHLSTVTSRFYQVSAGYSAEETIIGIVDGITVEGFYDNIAKQDTGQSVMVLSGTTGLELDLTDVLTDQDTLVVTSANLDNTSKYALGVSADGLSDDALLTSDSYTVAAGDPGTVEGFSFGTLLSEVVGNVSAPEGATMTIVDADGAYVPMKILNLDTVYVDVLATDKVFFDVVAADGITTLLFQLQPDGAATDAYVISNFYGIDQDQLLIEFIPEATTVDILYDNLIPAPGASMVLYDKDGNERLSGRIYSDDYMVVTAQDGTTTETYNLVMLIPDESFLTYVTSEVYTVDQINFEITSWKDMIHINTDVTMFAANLKPSASATITVFNSDMNENTSGKMVVGDVLEVLSGNQLKVIYYDIEVDPVTVQLNEAASISLYPNPSSGVVHVAGLETGNRIQVYNTMGQRIIDRFAMANEEILSLEGEQNGFYFVVVSDSKGKLGQYKLVID
jgi:hypothetical protein